MLSFHWTLPHFFFPLDDFAGDPFTVIHRSHARNRMLNLMSDGELTIELGVSLRDLQHSPILDSFSNPPCRKMHSVSYFSELGRQLARLYQGCYALNADTRYLSSLSSTQSPEPLMSLPSFLAS